MATPRKAWHRIADNVFGKPWDNDVLAAMVRLSALLHERWRTNGTNAADSCRIVLRDSDLMQITGVRRFDSALGILSRLADEVDLEILTDEVPCVYFIRSADRVKIGKTTCLSQRLATLRRTHPDAAVIGVIESLDFAKIERDLHQQYTEYRLEGEWFKANQFTTGPLHGHYRLTRAGSEAEVVSAREALHRVTVHWPKWAIFQGLDSRESPSVCPQNAPSALALAQAPSGKKEKKDAERLRSSGARPDLAASLASESSNGESPPVEPRKGWPENPDPEAVALQQKLDARKAKISARKTNAPLRAFDILDFRTEEQEQAERQAQQAEAEELKF